MADFVLEKEFRKRRINYLKCLQAVAGLLQSAISLFWGLKPPRSLKPPFVKRICDYRDNYSAIIDWIISENTLIIAPQARKHSNYTENT